MSMTGIDYFSATMIASEIGDIIRYDITKRRLLCSDPNILTYKQLRRRRECLNSCYRLTNFIYDGLDVQFEINSVKTQNLGDTVLLWQNGDDLDDVEQRRLIGLAVCHCGAGTEAGSGACYIKFGVVLPGNNTQMYFGSLLHVCETFAVYDIRRRNRLEQVVILLDRKDARYVRYT